jgi:hypothetical protein
MNAMGFYQVTPGSAIYAIGTPLFPSLTIHLDHGKTFTITAEGLTENNFYIRKATLNGQTFSKCFLSHSDILKGGELILSMGQFPNTDWGSLSGDFPSSAITDNLISPVPSVLQGKKNFTETTPLVLAAPLKNEIIYYTLDGSEPTTYSPDYQKPIRIDTTTTLRAFACLKGSLPSFLIQSHFQKIPKNRKIILNTKYSPQYTAGGDNALIDFDRGSDDFRTGAWQGYEGVDIDVTIDLGDIQPVHSLSAGFLQDQKSWIFYPVEVNFSISVDGVLYHEAGIIRNADPEMDEGSTTKDFTISLAQSSKARYVKMRAKNRGTCPPWHPGAGNKAWIFADEIMID